MSTQWKKVTVGEIAEVKGGKRLPKGKLVQDEPTPFPYLRVTDFGDNGLDTSAIKYIDEDAQSKVSRYTITNRDIYISIAGTIGRVGIVPAKFSGANLTENAAKICEIHPHVDERFLMYFLRTENGQGQIAGLTVGTSQPKLALFRIKEIEISLPDLPTQRKIAGILSAYDDLIENNLRRIKILEEMAQSLYREWFVHFRFPSHESARFIDSELGQIPKGWEIKKLGELADQMRRGVPKGELDGPIRYVGLEHIPRQSLALDAWEEKNELGSNKLTFERGEVLFGKIRPYFHKVSVAPFDGICSADTIVIRSKKPEYRALVTACVFTEAFVAHATATSNGSKMPRTDWKVLKDYPHVLPPKELLTRFSALFENAVAQQQNLVSRNQTLRSTRNLLLPKLLQNGPLLKP